MSSELWEAVNELHLTLGSSELRRAFTYDWRHWTIPEVREALLEAGFSRVDIYWEGTDRATGKGNDVYTVRKTAEPDPGWIAYLVAVK